MDRLTGAGCPTHLTVGEVGRFYENTNTGYIYECRSVTKDGDNVLNYAWELRVHGDHVDEHAELFGAGGSTSKYTQPEWGADTTTIVELLPETELSIMSADEPIAVVQQKVTLVSGWVYTVNYNGTEYERTAFEGEDVVMLGNAAADGGEDTGEPFFLGFYGDTSAAEMGFYGVVVPLDGSETFTLSIKGVSNEIYTIPEEYIQKVEPLYIEKEDEITSGAIRSAVEAGRQVFYSMGGVDGFAGSLLLNLSMLTAESATFVGVYPLGGGWDMTEFPACSVFTAKIDKNGSVEENNYNLTGVRYTV